MRFIQSKRDEARGRDRGQEGAGAELTRRVFNDDNQSIIYNFSTSPVHLVHCLCFQHLLLLHAGVARSRPASTSFIAFALALNKPSSSSSSSSSPLIHRF